jgi:Zn-dependent protease
LLDPAATPPTSTWRARLITIRRLPISVGIDFLVFLLFAFQELERTYREELRFLTSNTTLLSLASSLLIAFFLLAHEGAHVWAARRCDNRAVAILFNYFGVVASLEREMASPQEEFQVAVAGPLLSVLIALAFMAIHAWAGDLLRTGGSTSRVEFSGVLYASSGMGVVANWGIAVFNLLPFFPMDGGRLLRSTLWAITRNKKTATVLAGCCTVVGIIFLGAIAVHFFQRGAEAPGMRMGAFVILLAVFTFGNFRKELQSSRSC